MVVSQREAIDSMLNKAYDEGHYDGHACGYDEGYEAGYAFAREESLGLDA